MRDNPTFPHLFPSLEAATGFSIVSEARGGVFPWIPTGLTALQTPCYSRHARSIIYRNPLQALIDIRRTSKRRPDLHRSSPSPLHNRLSLTLLPTNQREERSSRKHAADQ
ncbi:hypothetical protein RRG08_018806 [Elysia crispata]|uniref:Uncharacterized protein n=1 Tax=Elysia crispata TaxID=231223 RepID=A0AAE0ZSL0_9GAST|nr:hypothetical protein RRG08_018806 [Elysia crispata]